MLEKREESDNYQVFAISHWERFYDSNAPMVALQ